MISVSTRSVARALAIVAALGVAACSYNAVPLASGGTNFYTTADDKISGKFLFAVDATSLTKMRVEDASKGYICGAHKVPVDAEAPFRSSVQQTMPLVFEESEMVAVSPGTESMRRDGVAGFVLVKVDGFQASVGYAKKFFGVDANAMVDLNVGISVVTPEGKILSSSVNATRSKITDGGFFCEGGSDAMAQATSLAIREAMERVAEKLSGSQKVRDAGKVAVATGSSSAPVSYHTRPSEAQQALAPLLPRRLIGAKRNGDLALIVGIDRYGRLPRADFAENDAARFAEYAVNALGVDPSKVKLLRGDQATRNDVVKALATWAKAEMMQGGSTVHVFFSGHGLASSDGKDVFLMPFDGDPTVLKESGIRREEIIARLSEAGAKDVVMVLDTCFSGGTRTGQTLMAYARPIAISPTAGAFPRNATVLSAASGAQLSSGLPAAKHGALSYFVMKGLEGEADANGDRRITAAELHAYVKDRVSKEAVRQGRDQIPELSGDGGKVLVEW
jgi:hypothetical protein